MEQTTQRLVHFLDERQAFTGAATGKCVLILPDQPLVWAIEGLRSSLESAADKV